MKEVSSVRCRVVMLLAALVAVVVPVRAEERPDGFAKASAFLEEAAAPQKRGGEQASASGSGSFESILGLASDIGMTARQSVYRSQDKVKIVPAHDYTVCNGPQCFSCTHIYETVCRPVKKKVCSHVGTDSMYCEVVIEEECTQVSKGHTCS